MITPLVHFFFPDSVRLISARSARLPPSPLLSARMMMLTYFSVTMIIIDQKIRLSTPTMWSWSTLSSWCPAKVSRNA
jgi:hypothetical protein